MSNDQEQRSNEELARLEGHQFYQLFRFISGKGKEDAPLPKLPARTHTPSRYPGERNYRPVASAGQVPSNLGANIPDAMKKHMIVA